MKVKSDFVTNSSSSSFIIKSGLTSIDVAEQMIEVIFEEDDFNDKKWFEGRQKKKIQVIELLEELKSKNYTGNIAIPYSINEVTYIYPEPFKFRTRVDTSHNHNWENGNVDIEYYLSEVEMYDTDENDLFLDVSDGKIKSKQQIEEDRYGSFKAGE